MKHQPIEQFRTVATVSPEPTNVVSSHRRLERWAELLEATPDRHLNTLRGTELYSPHLRELVRADGSPISVALADPRFRADGLKYDTYGDAKRFFDVSDRQMHDILCYCRFGSVTSAHIVAQAIRRVIAAKQNPSWFGRLRMRLSRQWDGSLQRQQV